MRTATPLAMLALAGGCALFDPPAAPAPSRVMVAPSDARSQAVEVTAYLGELRTMNPAALMAEARRQRRDSDLGRVKAALALTLAHPPDDGEILALVEPVTKKPGIEPELRAMASFLHAIAQDRRRLKENAAAASARLRDERRSQEALRNQADAAQERATRLQQKLDALTELEKSLSDRQTPSR